MRNQPEDMLLWQSHVTFRVLPAVSHTRLRNHDTVTLNPLVQSDSLFKFLTSVTAACVAWLMYFTHCLAALDSVAAVSMQEVSGAVSGSHAFKWSALQFADAALLLLDSEHHAVTQEEMEHLLGRRLTTHEAQRRAYGIPALEALVAADLLSLRPHCEWAVDVLTVNGQLTSPSTHSRQVM